jgi:hypothetical protein
MYNLHIKQALPSLSYYDSLLREKQTPWTLIVIEVRMCIQNNYLKQHNH